MSISSSTRKAGPYSCNGSTVVFPFAFKVFTAADVRAVLTDMNSVESDLALGTNYTVALNTDQNANPGGAITTTVTYATGYKITLTSQVQNLQPVTLTNQGGFYPKIINDALDRLTIMAQQLAEQVGRAVKISISSSSSSTPDQLLSDIGTAVTNASNSATAAASSATAAAGSATAASGSAADAANSATQAASSAAAVGFTVTDMQTQSKIAVTSAGTAPAFAVATVPAYGPLAAGQRMRVKFHAAGTTGSNTLNRDALGAKKLMQYDATGTKVAASIAAQMLADVEFDGTDFVILDPLPAMVVPGVRQTVLGGPVDSNGYPSFLPATSGSLSIISQSITTSAPLVVTAANGFGTTGPVDRVGQSTTNLAWTGLTASATNYLYVDVASNGGLTPGSTTLAPAYQFGGTRSTTNNQATFNTQEMSMTVGNGSAAPQAYRVFVGEAVTSTSAVINAVAYAYQGKYKKSGLPLSVGMNTNMAHNIGFQDVTGYYIGIDANNGNKHVYRSFSQSYDSASRSAHLLNTDRNNAAMTAANGADAVSWYWDGTGRGLTGGSATADVFLNRGW